MVSIFKTLPPGSFSFFDARTESGEQIRYNWIEDILADHSGNIWVNAPNQGVFRYQVETGSCSATFLVPVKIKVRTFRNPSVWIKTVRLGRYVWSGNLLL